MEAKAILRSARISAQKARLVADQVRGLAVGHATNLLTFSDKKAAHLIKKVLLSAVANAENNLGADVDELKVATIFVDEGPSLKRMHARAKGRGYAHHQAHQPHHRGRRRSKGQDERWVIKFIPPVSALASPRTGIPSGSPTSAITPATSAADLKVRELLKKKLAQAGISKILIERPAKTARVTIHTARPGVVIGKKGEDIEKLRKEVSQVMGVPAHINVTEVRKPELDAQLVAESIAQQLERRIMFRRAMKRSVQNAMRLGALGIKVNVGGRLNGAEIARSEWYREGRVPLHTLRADIDYGFAEAKTTYGIIGVKVWIYKGEIFDLHASQQEAKAEASEERPPRRAPAEAGSVSHVATQANQIPQGAEEPQPRALLMSPTRSASASSVSRRRRTVT